MFSPTARINSKSEHDRLLRQRAVEEAQVLFSAHGIDAARLMAVETRTPAHHADERRYGRLVILEIERLERTRRQDAMATALVPWKPRLFSARGMARLLGRGLRRRR